MTKFFASMAILALAGAAVSATLPRKSPEFSVLMIGGSQVSISQYQGKVVVLAMILTTCPHCQATTRTLNALQKEFGPRGLQVIEGAMTRQPDVEIPQFIKDYSTSFPVGQIDPGAAATYMGYGLQDRHFVPYLVFIDRNGMIRGQYDGKDAFNAEAVQTKNIRTMVEKLVAEGKTSASR